MIKKTKTILIAEDDRTTRLVMKKVLENEGYNVIEGDRGEKSLFLALEKDVDAFLIDINMPGLSGIEICERIRSIARYKFTPIICITSMEEESNLEEVFSAGATDFISKPANPIILKARLKAHLLDVSQDIVKVVSSPDLHFDVPKYISMKGIKQPVGIYHLNWAEKIYNQPVYV